MDTPNANTPFEGNKPFENENRSAPDEKAANEKPKETAESSADSIFANDGSYEIVFGNNRMREDTRYRANGYNAYGFNANGNGTYRPAESSTDSRQNPADKHKKKGKNEGDKGRRASLVLLVVASLLFVAALTLCITSLVVIRQGTPGMAITSPTETAPVEPWVNPADINTADVYANAAAKTVNSVVVISGNSSSGSGIIWAVGDTLSYVLTCHHVIEGQSEIKVTLNNDESYYAEVVGADARTDIAILKIDATDLAPITLPADDSALRLGQAVIAIGNPLGVLGNSVTNGILSSLARVITVEGISMEVIQTNAAVNSGNSGGGLFDMNGQLIGMVNAKVGQTAVEGIGFAIPYTTLKTIAGELIEKGYVSGRPQIGISTVTVNDSTINSVLQKYPDLESYLGVKRLNGFFGGYTYYKGVYVIDATGVFAYAEDSAQFEYGDRITAIGGTSVSSEEEIETALYDYVAGDTIQITVSRQNKPIIIELVLGEINK